MPEENLTSRTTKEYLLRGLKAVGRGLGNTGAALVAAPLGFAEWALKMDTYTSPAERRHQLQKDIPDDCFGSKERLIEGIVAERERCDEFTRPNLRRYITNWYLGLKP